MRARPRSDLLSMDCLEFRPLLMLLLLLFMALRSKFIGVSLYSWKNSNRTTGSAMAMRKLSADQVDLSKLNEERNITAAIYHSLLSPPLPVKAISSVAINRHHTL